MNSILIFDNLNDVIYSKYNKQFSSHLQKLGIQQGLVSPEEKDGLVDKPLNPNLLIQLFSPMVTSQRIMSMHFGNSYTSVQCEDGTNVVFDEYMGFLFLCIGTESVTLLQHTLSVFISLVRHVCGPDVAELKSNARLLSLLNRLTDTWQELKSQDQACLVEALEQLSVNADITATSINALKDACASLKSAHTVFDCSRSHALLFVENKLLALFTSREAEDLSPSDTLFLSILSSRYFNNKISSRPDNTDGIPEQSNDSSPNSDGNSVSEGGECSDMNTHIIKHEIVLLQGKKVFIPHAVHMSHFNSGLTFVLLYQICNENLSTGFDDAFTSLAKFNKLVGSDTEIEVQKKVYECLDSGIKKILDSLKKIKNKQEIEHVVKQLHTKWEQIKKRYSECIKNNEDICNNLGASITNLSSTFRQLYQAMCSTDFPVNSEIISKIAQDTQKSLMHFTEFLKAKAHHNFTMRSALLTINKYLEEFPGLVHFLYIDRTNHRVTAPFLHFSSEETNLLATKKIWEMVELSRNHIRDGHMAFMWKDTTFNYAYYLWFEDTSGTPLKPKVNPLNVIKTLPMPGILAGDFYKCLIEACFPKMTSKVRCFELYCIHLGLATSSCVLDQSRRIAATVWEVTGQQSSSTNLF